MKRITRTFLTSVLLLLVLVLVTPPAGATVLLFEKVGLPMAKELQGLQSVKNYGDNVTGVSTGGFANSFAKGNGWTPNIALDFSAGFQ